MQISTDTGNISADAGNISTDAYGNGIKLMLIIFYKSIMHIITDIDHI